MESKNLIFLVEEIEKIGKIEKCLACGCFYDTLLQFREILEKEKVAESLKARLTRVIEKVNVDYNCLGCEPCYPVPVANALAEMAVSSAPCACGAVCEPAGRKEETTSWPVEPGEYLVGSGISPIAISTLGSDQLPEVIAGRLGKEGFALVGGTHTENIGIEKVVKNTISNPHLRFILLCGRDTRGHHSGPSLMALFQEGVDEEKRIIGSPGKRPFLKNLESAEIAHFRSQMEIIDLIDCEDIKRIEAEAKLCREKNPGKFEQERTIRKVPQIEAQPSKKLILDPAGFFILYPRKEEGRIYLEHYLADGAAHEVISGEDPLSIASTAIERGLVSRLDHATYLGRELEKAYLSMRYGFTYVQDKAPGEEDEKTCP